MSEEDTSIFYEDMERVLRKRGYDNLVGEVEFSDLIVELINILYVTLSKVEVYADSERLYLFRNDEEAGGVVPFDNYSSLVQLLIKAKQNDII